jgi:hypothetical protein
LFHDENISAAASWRSTNIEIDEIVDSTSVTNAEFTDLTHSSDGELLRSACRFCRQNGRKLPKV